MKKIIFCLFAILIFMTGCKGKNISLESDSDTDNTNKTITSDNTNEITITQETEDTLTSQKQTQEITSESSSEESTSSETTDEATVETTTESTTEALPQIVTALIPEGFTVTQIAARLEANDVCTADGFLDAVNNYDFTYYPLVAGITNTSDRAFKLEGYLFPQTYEFYTNDKPENAVGKLLRQAENSITDQMKSKAQSLGYSIDEILTIASIIQKECGKISEMENVSAVLHNRLNDGKRLQCDVTIYYIEDKVKPFITGDKNRYNSLYNTYKCSALPAGAICNPGTSAINAALNPSDIDSQFFFTNADNEYIYSKTYEEHKQKLSENKVIENTFQSWF